MKDHRILYLFDRYLQNTCTADELAELLDLLDVIRTSEGDHILDPALFRLWEMCSVRPEASDRVDWMSMLERVKAVPSVAPMATTMPPVFSMPRSQRMRLGWVKYAAAVLLFLMLGLGLVYYQGYFLSDPLSPDPEKALVKIVVPIIEQDTLILADGSRVILNAGSTLRYPEIFDNTLREVYLEGEGFFEILPDAARPFVVHAGGLRTEVLGTSFNVNAYAQQSRLEVTVVTGKVRVQETRSGRQVELMPREKLRYIPADESFFKIEAVDVEQTLIWNTGRLAFEDASLSDIALQYYNRYGRQLEIRGEGLEHCRLSMVFDQESPDEILHIITTLTGTHIKEESGKLILYGPGCLPLDR